MPHQEKASPETPPAVSGSESGKPLVDLRSAVVVMCAGLVGLAAGVLTFLAAFSLPQAVLVGGGAFGGAVFFFDRVIGR
ncbi:hypothetical protein FXF51_32870 [Nonomuraea sp. PA05]|nr:hypothetical protein FXF51_32870 [Nonomuraea sp. PA05]